METRRRRVIGVRRGGWALEATALAWLAGCGRPAGEGAALPVAPAPAVSAPVAGPSGPPESSDKLLVTESEYQGWKYYAVYCERCHAPDAVGTADAPDLRYSVSPDGEVTADSFRVIVRDGTENREMKGFEELLDDQRIDQVYAYIKARSEGRLAAGRPHRAPER